jgi:septal ring factor EnvC (AmiA/AmiB activator)
MRFISLVIVIILCLQNIAKGQTKADLEEKRKKALEEIGYVDGLLKTTAREKSEGINDVKILGRKVDLRESVIYGIKQEINLLAERIDLNNLAINMMEDDLVKLKADYAKAVVNSYRLKKGYPELIYILSAQDFNQGYKRLKYLQQVTKYRRKESEIILELKSQIESSKMRLVRDLSRMSDLKSREEVQKKLLENEQERKRQLVKSLTNKEKQLQKDLEEKKRIARKIENEIDRLIEEEKRRSAKTVTTPEQKIISDNFAENMGRLPWPVERGVITSHFGVHPHPVFKYLTEDNIGIEITSSGKTLARSVFQGEVAKVFAISGANMTVIVRHGRYLSVYANISNVKVRPGEKVSAKQELGEIYLDPKNGDSSVLKFMIFETNQKYLDPESWIVKN